MGFISCTNLKLSMLPFLGFSYGCRPFLLKTFSNASTFASLKLPTRKRYLFNLHSLFLLFGCQVCGKTEPFYNKPMLTTVYLWRCPRSFLLVDISMPENTEVLSTWLFLLYFWLEPKVPKVQDCWIAARCIYSNPEHDWRSAIEARPKCTFQNFKEL